MCQTGCFCEWLREMYWWKRQLTFRAGHTSCSPHTHPHITHTHTPVLVTHSFVQQTLWNTRSRPYVSVSPSLALCLQLSFLSALIAFSPFVLHIFITLSAHHSQNITSSLLGDPTIDDFITCDENVKFFCFTDKNSPHIYSIITRRKKITVDLNNL